MSRFVELASNKPHPPTGIRVGHWHLTWWDLWASRPCFEISKEEK